MLIDELAGDHQPQTGTSMPLGAEKRGEELRLHLLGHLVRAQIVAADDANASL